MSDWSDGYVTEINYSYGYFRELSPTLQRFILLAKGLVPPVDSGAVLELGYGQGISAVVHAAATGQPFWGTDFNPAHAANALGLTNAAGMEVNLFDQSFAEFAQRDDLPKFNYIGLHGIWSWVSDENRKHIVEIVRRSLAVGGVFYASYNTLPGWSALLPARHLLTLHASLSGAESHGISQRISQSIQFSERLVTENAKYFQDYPAAANHVKKIANYDRHYLAHEYFNRDWQPMFFYDIAEWFRTAKVEFAASAHLADHIDLANLTAEAQAALKEINHPVMREAVRDFYVNQGFRRDLFVRGQRRLIQAEQWHQLEAMRFVLLTPVEDITFKISGFLGERSLNGQAFKPVVDAFAKESYRPRSLAEVRSELPAAVADPELLLQVLVTLIASNHLFPAQSEASTQRAQPSARALNSAILDRIHTGHNEMTVLASPVAGCGIVVPYFQQVFLLAHRAGKVTSHEKANWVWQTLLLPYKKLVIKDGKTLSSVEENIAYLEQEASNFERRLPILTALGIG
ncbi:MAG: class I SAM-dependent methyltransferase [Magnetococcales bacterium]|nr:class I SAM-dependent methyltransferase [Magnetococcales bacterium]